MDLAHYAVTTVLVDGRPLCAVAASTGRSKSWDHATSAVEEALRRPDEIVRIAIDELIHTPSA